MFMLNTTLLREKFILREGAGDTNPVTATGNRIALPLFSKTGSREERLIVRGQNMHTTLRMAAMICKAYFREGPILTRAPSFPWGPNWEAALPEYERENNQSSWIGVYSGGRSIFKQGRYHPFLDIIEQCDARNRDDYDRAISIAENAFNVAGRGITIEHNTNIAMVIGAMLEKTRIGLILRDPRHTSTFNFGVDAKTDAATKDRLLPEPHRSLLHAAAWLELIQLSVHAGFQKALKKTKTTNEATLQSTLRRIDKLNAELAQFEESFNVSYRPERPNVLDIVDKTIAFAKGG